MDHDSYPDTYIRGILNTVKSIAMIGISPKDSRPSYFAFKYLLERGYNMIPVNPGQAGKQILGRKVYARVGDIPEPIDMIDVFRASQYAMPIVEEALKLQRRPQVIWMQLGVRNDEAAAKESRGCRHQGRDEPLSENRVRPALLRDRLDGREFSDAHVEKGQAARRPRATNGARSRHVRGRRDASRRPRAKNPGRSPGPTKFRSIDEAGLTLAPRC